MIAGNENRGFPDGFMLSNLGFEKEGLSPTIKLAVPTDQVKHRRCGGRFDGERGRQIYL